MDNSSIERIEKARQRVAIQKEWEASTTPSPAFTFTGNGLVIRKRLSQDEFVEAMAMAHKIRDIGSWAIARLLVYAKEHFGNQYEHVLSLCPDVSIQTLYNYMPTGERFSEVEVHPELTFSDYREMTPEWIPKERALAILSEAVGVHEDRRGWLREKKRELRKELFDEEQQPTSYTETVTVREDGSYQGEPLPLYLRGKKVQITYKIIEDENL